MRTAATLLAVVLLLYAAACAALFAYQRSLVYFPQPKSFGTPASSQVLSVPGAELVVSARPQAGPKALVYFGGNAEDVSASLESFAGAFPQHAIYLLHYRGYGGSSGRPSEAVLHADAQALFDKVHRDHPEVAVVGRSLGSGVAIRLAVQRPAARLVLVTPYDSIEEIAVQQFPFFPVRWLLTEKFESWRHAPQVRVPTLLLAAEFDEVIPPASTRRLHQRFAPGVATLVVVPGTGHNNISNAPAYLGAMQRAL